VSYKIVLTTALLAGGYFTASAQNAKPEDTEVWQPEPKVITAGKTVSDAPSDAIVLFGGKNLDEWASANDDSKPAPWPVEKGIFTVKKSEGGIITKRKFTNYQLHVEWRVPIRVTNYRCLMLTRTKLM
jgi:hypothetical protein